MGNEKIDILGKAVLKGKGPALILECPNVGRRFEHNLTLPYRDFITLQRKEPIRLSDIYGPYWLFRDRLIRAAGEPDEELQLRIKHKVLREEHDLARIKREIEAIENMEKVPSARRARIPESVQRFVWQRDEGKCVKCGSREQLEFDHIIPVSKGGSNTARNIQLMCEPCNRQKGDSI
jgi:hypothetical protein